MSIGSQQHCHCMCCHGGIVSLFLKSFEQTKQFSYPTLAKWAPIDYKHCGSAVLNDITPLLCYCALPCILPSYQGYNEVPDWFQRQFWTPGSNQAWLWTTSQNTFPDVLSHLLLTQIWVSNLKVCKATGTDPGHPQVHSCSSLQQMVDVTETHSSGRARVVKVRFGQVQSKICRTENWTLGSVLTMYRTLDRTMGSVLNSLVLVPGWSEPRTEP